MKSKTKNSFEFLKFLSVVKNRENVFNLFHASVKSFSLLILMLFQCIYNHKLNKMGKKLKFLGIVVSIVIAMSLGIFYEQFVEKIAAEKSMNEILDSKNKILSFGGGKIEGCEGPADMGGETYKINENGSVEFIESANQGLSKEPCHWHENCFKVTANDTLPINVRGKDKGYGAGKKPEILKTNNTTLFNETEIK